MPSDELHRLIKSLSPSEKRYFTLQASMQGGGKNYLELFEAIDRMSIYDESALKRKLGDRPYLRQLNVAKRYLHDLILKTLRGYHAGGSAAVEVKECMHSAEILLEKGLTDQAAKMIDRAIRIAAKESLALPLAAALRWRWRLGGNTFASEEEIEASFAPLFETLDRVEREIEAMRDAPASPSDDAASISADELRPVSSGGRS